jgi:hypothetical protein
MNNMAVTEKDVLDEIERLEEEKKKSEKEKRESQPTK